MMVNVKIIQAAYEQLLIHILQYGNKNLRKSEEVMGLCYGVRSGDSIEIQKIVPIKHGSDCEKAFGETDFVAFNEVDEKVTQEGLESCGYYITHPKMGFYLSQNEIKNLLYFINEKNIPYAIAIIGDHNQLEEPENYGIQAFQLVDPSKGIGSDFEKVELEITPPEGFSIFKTTKFLIEQAQRHTPYVEEKGVQLQADSSIWDTMSETETPEEKARKKLQPMVDVLQNEVSNLDQSFLQSSLTAYNTFIDEMVQIITKSLNDPTNDLVTMRIAIEDGLRNISKWFKQTLINQGQKVYEDFERTIQMVDDGNKSTDLAFKKVLISLLQKYQR
jgi:proteasome lid subunit RPN8/RPN11